MEDNHVCAAEHLIIPTESGALYFAAVTPVVKSTS
ncbi:hypothetical protein SAMN06295943_0009 [Agreia sp. VKM Ac-1783]|nr:hypothetical protein SAMN06295943_0009 [Agreia sp. VKM Ac-1783]